MAKTLAPSSEYTSEEWRQHHAEHPETVLQMLGDIFRVYKAQERKRAGQGNPSGGRRKRTIEGSLEELFAIITPRISLDPFPKAYATLFPGCSVRSVAERAKMPHQDISRKLRGEQPVTNFDLERLARAADVHPAYFVEWRARIIAELITAVFETNPNLSITVLKRLAL